MMSLITKFFSRKKEQGDQGKKERTDEVPMVKSTFDYAAVEINVSNKEQLDKSSVDILLNYQELGEYEEVDISKININQLDFDLSEDMEDVTGMPRSNVLSINPFNSFSHPVDLDLNRLNRQGFVTPDMANTELSNSFRMIKRPILNNAKGKGATVVDNANLIMVTSSLSGEGKSYTAINLALSIAMEKNKRVLLIDADVNKPSHHDIFGISMESGLTDFLSGRVADMSRVLFKTNVPSLTLMFAGTLTSHATELLASETMEQFVQEISTRYPDRIIIFDSPPMLLTTESSVLASHMGQVIVVVEAEKTLQYQLKKSLSLINNEIVLLMLNKMREKNEAGNYGYYGYGHQG
jgi:protein-tyrosine kinase